MAGNSMSAAAYQYGIAMPPPPLPPSTPAAPHDFLLDHNDDDDDCNVRSSSSFAPHDTFQHALEQAQRALLVHWQDPLPAPELQQVADTLQASFITARRTVPVSVWLGTNNNNNHNMNRISPEDHDLAAATYLWCNLAAWSTGTTSLADWHVALRATMTAPDNQDQDEHDNTWRLSWLWRHLLMRDDDDDAAKWTTTELWTLDGSGLLQLVGWVRQHSVARCSMAAAAAAAPAPDPPPPDDDDAALAAVRPTKRRRITYEAAAAAATASNDDDDVWHVALVYLIGRIMLLMGDAVFVDRMLNNDDDLDRMIATCTALVPRHDHGRHQLGILPLSRYAGLALWAWDVQGFIAWQLANVSPPPPPPDTRRYSLRRVAEMLEVEQGTLALCARATALSEHALASFLVDMWCTWMENHAHHHLTAANVARAGLRLLSTVAVERYLTSLPVLSDPDVARRAVPPPPPRPDHVNAVRWYRQQRHCPVVTVVHLLLLRPGDARQAATYTMSFLNSMQRSGAGRLTVYEHRCCIAPVLEHLMHERIYLVNCDNLWLPRELVPMMSEQAFGMLCESYHGLPAKVGALAHATTGEKQYIWHACRQSLLWVAKTRYSLQQGLRYLEEHNYISLQTLTTDASRQQFWQTQVRQPNPVPASLVEEGNNTDASCDAQVDIHELLLRDGHHREAAEARAREVAAAAAAAAAAAQLEGEQRAREVAIQKATGAGRAHEKEAAVAKVAARSPQAALAEDLPPPPPDVAQESVDDLMELDSAPSSGEEGSGHGGTEAHDTPTPATEAHDDDDSDDGSAGDDNVSPRSRATPHTTASQPLSMYGSPSQRTVPDRDSFATAIGSRLSPDATMAEDDNLDAFMSPGEATATSAQFSSMRGSPQDDGLADLRDARSPNESLVHSHTDGSRELSNDDEHYENESLSDQSALPDKEPSPHYAGAADAPARPVVHVETTGTDTLPHSLHMDPTAEGYLAEDSQQEASQEEEHTGEDEDDHDSLMQPPVPAPAAPAERHVGFAPAPVEQIVGEVDDGYLAEESQTDDKEQSKALNEGYLGEESQVEQTEESEEDEEEEGRVVQAMHANGTAGVRPIQRADSQSLSDMELADERTRGTDETAESSIGEDAPRRQSFGSPRVVGTTDRKSGQNLDYFATRTQHVMSHSGYPSEGHRASSEGSATLNSAMKAGTELADPSTISSAAAERSLQSRESSIAADEAVAEQLSQGVGSIAERDNLAPETLLVEDALNHAPTTRLRNDIWSTAATAGGERLDEASLPSAPATPLDLSRDVIDGGSPTICVDVPSSILRQTRHQNDASLATDVAVEGDMSAEESIESNSGAAINVPLDIRIAGGEEGDEEQGDDTDKKPASRKHSRAVAEPQQLEGDTNANEESIHAPNSPKLSASSTKKRRKAVQGALPDPTLPWKRRRTPDGSDQPATEERTDEYHQDDSVDDESSASSDPKEALNKEDNKASDDDGDDDESHNEDKEPKARASTRNMPSPTKKGTGQRPPLPPIRTTVKKERQSPTRTFTPPRTRAKAASPASSTRSFRTSNNKALESPTSKRGRGRPANRRASPIRSSRASSPASSISSRKATAALSSTSRRSTRARSSVVPAPSTSTKRSKRSSNTAESASEASGPATRTRRAKASPPLRRNNRRNANLEDEPDSNDDQSDSVGDTAMGASDEGAVDPKSARRRRRPRTRLAARKEAADAAENDNEIGSDGTEDAAAGADARPRRSTRSRPQRRAAKGQRGDDNYIDIAMDLPSALRTRRSRRTRIPEQKQGDTTDDNEDHHSMAASSVEDGSIASRLRTRRKR